MIRYCSHCSRKAFYERFGLTNAIPSDVQVQFRLLITVWLHVDNLARSVVKFVQFQGTPLMKCTLLPAPRDCSEVARALNRRCYPHTGNGGHCWCLSSSLFHIGWSHGCCPVRATGDSLPSGRYLGIKKEARALWHSGLSLHQLGSLPTLETTP